MQEAINRTRFLAKNAQLLFTKMKQILDVYFTRDKTSIFLLVTLNHRNSSGSFIELISLYWD